MFRISRQCLQFIKCWLSRYRACHQLIPPFRLLSHYQEMARTVVIFADKKGRVCNEHLANIARSQRHIQQFSQQDAHLLGYLLGHEDAMMAFMHEKT